MLILTDEQAKGTLKMVREWEKSLFEERKALEAEGRTPEEIRHLQDPRMTFYLGMLEDYLHYLRIRKGDIPLLGPNQLGLALVYCRIASGLTQEEWSQTCGVPLLVLRRNEDNEYYGVPREEIEHLIARLGYTWEPVTQYRPVRE